MARVGDRVKSDASVKVRLPKAPTGENPHRAEGIVNEIIRRPPPSRGLVKIQRPAQPGALNPFEGVLHCSPARCMGFSFRAEPQHFESPVLPTCRTCS